VFATERERSQKARGENLIGVLPEDWEGEGQYLADAAQLLSTSAAGDIASVLEQMS